MVNLPWDALSEILVRLPVKSVARFRCVNKEWCNLLKNTGFVKSQYKLAVEMNRFSLLYHCQSHIDTFSFDPISVTCEVSRQLYYRGEDKEYGIAFYGCCNGLVFFSHVNKLNVPVLTLWNPATNECKKLPDPPTRLEDNQSYVEYGFGYDSQIEDFKVVQIAEDFGTTWWDVQVYTLRLNIWRRINDIQVGKLFNYYQYRSPDMGRLPVNGGFYWKSFVEKGDSGTDNILHFDFKKEEFDLIPIPNEVNDDYERHNDDYERHLCVLGGSLWLFVYDHACLKFWELKDNGVKKSWTRSFSIDTHKFDIRGDLIPLLFLENGKTLSVAHNYYSLHFVLHDQKCETTTTVKVHEAFGTSSFRTSVYVESLIALNTGTYLGKVHWDLDTVSEEEEEEDDGYEIDEDEDDNDGDDDGYVRW